MLKELKKVRQNPGEHERRCFIDETFELTVWFSSNNDPVGFQLCYPLETEKKALTWHEDTGYSHDTVDEGEDRPGRHKMTPILVADGVFDKQTIGSLLKDACLELDSTLADFVIEKIKQYHL